MLARTAHLFFVEPTDYKPLVKKSYDRISENYDQTWTHHTRELAESLIENLNPRQGDICIDLTCGTGFATNLLAEKAGTKAVGVDSSGGMLAQAITKYGDKCSFVEADALRYLKDCESSSADIITCCWGLGYCRPFAVLRQIKRVLKPGGKVAIIDNSLFSLREIMYCSFLTFAEHPEKLQNLMRFKFLPNSMILHVMFRLLNLNSLNTSDGKKSYIAASGRLAIERLRATGAAAGFEYASDEKDQEQIFDRFAEIIEEKYMTPEGITVTHRYLSGIAQK